MSTPRPPDSPAGEPGDVTVEMVQALHDEGIEHIVLVMRHSAREYAPGRHDLENPLTDEGRELAKLMGQRLPKQLTLRGYSSPAERCVETADLIMSSHSEHGGTVIRNRVMEAMGVFYVLDQMKMYMAMRDAGGLVNLLNQWYAGKIARDIMMPPDLAAALIKDIAAEKLKERPPAPQLDLLVSHDFTLYTLKDRLLQQDSDRYPEVRFLDGVAFYVKNNQLHARSHHEDARILS